jgi:Rrf2 family protein
MEMLAITPRSATAVRALSELARRGGTDPVPIAEIARARDIPVQVLEALFAALRRGGILASQRGVKGGYTFARPPADVTVLEVVELLDGALGPGAVAAGYPWADAADAARGILDSVTIAEAAQREASSGAAMYYI